MSVENIIILEVDWEVMCNDCAKSTKNKRECHIMAASISFLSGFSSVITNQTIVINNMSDYKVIVEERSASKMKVTAPSEIDSESYGEINVRIEPGFGTKPS